MATINHQEREISLKIVFYGPGLGGKTSSLQALHRALNAQRRGQLVSLSTGSDRTLYFDFLPVRAKVQQLSVRLQLYTVPGQVHYNSTRKLVLSGADAIVFVADSQRARMGANAESLANLEENLLEQGRSIEELPLVLQYNKRDVSDPVPVEELQAALNERNVPHFETVATTGTGVFDVLKRTALLTLRQLQLEGKAHAPKRPHLEVPTVAPKDDSTTRFGSSPLAASVQHLTDQVAQLAPERHRSSSGAHDLPTQPSGRTLAHLSHGKAQSWIALVENDIDKSDWAAAVTHASAGAHRLAVDLAGQNVESPTEAAAVAALMLGLPASWYQRFCETERRVRSSGGVSSEDAMFALLYLTCAALRAYEAEQLPEH